MRVMLYILLTIYCHFTFAQRAEGPRVKGICFNCKQSAGIPSSNGFQITNEAVNGNTGEVEHRSTFFAVGAAGENLGRALEARALADLAQQQADLARAEANRADAQAMLADSQVELNKSARELQEAFKTEPPPAPRRFGFFGSIGNAKSSSGSKGNSIELLGSAYEIIPNSGLYITARHVLKTVDRTTGLVFEGFKFYGLEDPRGGIVDVVLIQTGDISPASLDTLDFANVRINDFWYSFQTGSTTYDDTLQSSFGKVQRIHNDNFHFLLELEGQNFSSPASSGSLVWTRQDEGSPWALGGVISCQEHAASSHFQRAGVRVVRLDALRASDFSELTESDIRKEIPNLANCTPIDRRMGGGD